MTDGFQSSTSADPHIQEAQTQFFNISFHSPVTNFCGLILPHTFSLLVAACMQMFQYEVFAQGIPGAKV